MTAKTDHFELRLATAEVDLLGAQRLRYSVFVEELGGDGAMVDHTARLERDHFDDCFDHLVLIDTRRDAAALDHVVGAYRLMTDRAAARGGGFYSSGEYDLTPLLTSGRRLLELGRSCLHRDYRGGTGLMRLWSGVADYVASHGTEVLFGVASFHGTDLQALAQPLAFLHHRHLAPAPLRVRARPEHFAAMDLLSEADLDRTAAARAIPALIKGYLRLGGWVGEGAFVDHAFNTTDICLVMDTTNIDPRQKGLYGQRA